MAVCWIEVQSLRAFTISSHFDNGIHNHVHACGPQDERSSHHEALCLLAYRDCLTESCLRLFRFGAQLAAGSASRMNRGEEMHGHIKGLVPGPIARAAGVLEVAVAQQQ